MPNRPRSFVSVEGGRAVGSRSSSSRTTALGSRSSVRTPRTSSRGRASASSGRRDALLRSVASRAAGRWRRTAGRCGPRASSSRWASANSPAFRPSPRVRFHEDEPRTSSRMGSRVRPSKVSRTSSSSGEAVRRLGLRCAACGYPVVSPSLAWSDGLHVTGPLAELELGPSSRNIAGARRAADRLVAAA